ncbi:MAG: hypothetical protein V1820_05865 [archaeon]
MADKKRGLIRRQFRLAELERELAGVGTDLPLGKLAFGAAGLASALAALSALSVFNGNLPLAAISLGGVLLALRIPEISAKIACAVARKSLERELPFFLSRYSHLAALGVNPLKALEISVGFGGPVGKVAGGALFSARKGIPLEKALENASEETLSERAEEAFSAISSVLSDGYTGSARELIDGIYKGLLEEHKAALEEYSARSQIVFLSVVFSTAIIPALAAFALAFSESGNPVAAPVLFILAFPAIAAAQFLYMRFSSP